MKVINPNNTTHSISLIPRYYPEDEVIFTLYNEATKENIVVENTYNIENGVLNLCFDYTFTNKDKFQFKIEDTNIIYRGKLTITEQNTQEFRLTEDIFIYE